MDVSASQPYKKLYLVELNLAGSLIAVRDVQFTKAPALIVSDEAVSSAKSTVSRAVQHKNADVEIMFTDPGITAFLRAVQPENASVANVGVPLWNGNSRYRIVVLKCAADLGNRICCAGKFSFGRQDNISALCRYTI